MLLVLGVGSISAGDNVGNNHVMSSLVLRYAFDLMQRDS